MKTRLLVLLGLAVTSCAVWLGLRLSTSTKDPVSQREGAVADVTGHASTRLPESASSPVPAAPASLSVSATKLPAVIPAGSVKVPPANPDAPEAIQSFRNWSERYFLAEPAQREALIPEGQKLAEAHRNALGQMIPEDPKHAIENAVPMVVRQDLPFEITGRLEQRVNSRGSLLVTGVVPKEQPSAPLVAPIQRWFTPAAAAKGGKESKTERYSAFVYGERAGQSTLTETRVSGVAVDGKLAVLDSSIRVLEVGERPDSTKQLVSICPVSGIETVLPSSADAPAPAVAENTPAAEDDTTIHYFCAGGHIVEYAKRLAADERSKYWQTQGVAAEGATGGALFPFGPPVAFTTGTKSILYIRCAFPEQGYDPQSDEQCYANLKQTTDFFMDNSRGRFYLTATVAPLVVLPYPESWYLASRDGNNQPDGDFVIYDHARELARRMGYDTNNFNLDVVRWDNGPGSYGGLGAVGGKLVILKTSAVGVLMHELGHNLGLLHSNFWQTNPPTRIGAGANVEYGNIFDVMGNSGSLGHYVAAHKAIINWLTVDQIHDVRSNGTYRVYQTDQGQADAGKRYALRVNRDSERNYWLEMRQQFTQPALLGGLMLTWDSWGYSGNSTAYGSNGGAQLIDTTPGSGSSTDSRNDAAIAIGKTFSDASIDLHITPIAKGTASPPYIDVVVNRGPFPGNQSPTLSAVSGPVTAALGVAASFSVTGTDPDSDPLSYSWDFGDGTFSTDGLRTQTKTWTTDGDYRVVCTVTDMKGKRATRGITVVVGTGGTGFAVSGTITDSLGNPMEGLYVANRTLTANPTQSAANAASFRYAITDSNGLYVLTNMPAGNTTITPHNPPYTFTPTFPNPLNVQADSSGRNLQMSAGVSGNTLTVAVVDGTATEAAGAGRTATITLTRSATSGTLDVPFMVGSSGTAIRNTDYTLNPVPATVNNTGGGLRYQFANNQATITIVLTAANDPDPEGEEYAVLEFPDAVTNYSRVGPTTISIPITDNDSNKSVVTLIQSEPSSAEAGDTASFILNRNGDSTNPLTVNLTYGPASGLTSATPVTDYTAPASVVIPANAASATFNIAAFDDIYAEGTEFGTVSITADAAYERDTQQRSAQFYITDNDQPTLSVVATDAAATEAAGNPGKFTITRSARDLSLPLTVQYSMGGSALQGKDYRRVDGTALIPAHELSVDIEITPMEDSINEPDQTVICRLATDDAYAIAAPGSATVTITDNDGPEVSIRAIPATNNFTNPASSYTGRVLEPNAGPPVAGPATKNVFQVTIPSPAATALTIPITFTGTATKDVDYNGYPATVSIPIGSTSVNVPVTFVDDARQEDTESLIATLGTGVGYKLTSAKSAYVQIQDGDQPTVDASLEDQSSDLGHFFEDGGTFRFFIGRTNTNPNDTTYTGNLSVPFTLTGLPGADYAATASPLLIPGGSAGAYVTITPVNDNVAKGTRSLTLTITNTGAYGIGTPTATAVIEDDDAYTGAAPPSVQFAAATSSVNERNATGGPSSLVIPVNITGTRSGSVSVDYFVSSGTATGGGVDYTLASGKLTFGVADTTKSITLSTTPDGFPEGNETLVITLTYNVGTNIGAIDTHSVTITDLAIPEALTDTVVNLPGSTATLRGRATGNGILTDAWIEWGTSSSSFPNSTAHEAIGSGHSLVSLTSPTITGLNYPGTYYYRTVAQNSIGTTRGITRVIRTAAPPVGSTLPTTIHDATSATLFGSVNPNRLNAEIWFEWGTTTAYGNLTPRQGVVASTVPVTVSTPITGLTPDTIYHYRFNAQTSLGTVQGEDMIFASVPHKVAGDLLVNIHAKQGSAGTASWINNGALGGVFAAGGSPAAEADVQNTGIPGVLLDGSTSNYTGPNSNADIEANSNRTIEAWVLNPGLGSSDDIVSLGQTGVLTQNTLAYNNDTTHGAFRHDGAANDAGYPAASFPALGKWHHLVYTYNGNKVAKLYIDGALKITKTLSGNLATTAGSINLGTTRTAPGLLTGGNFHGYINSLRIHGGELSATDVTTNFNLGPALPAAAAPLAITKGASSITSSTATLNASVVPQGSATTAWIEWGTSTSYDNATTPQSVGSAWTPSSLAVPISGLASGIEYHFRVVTQNASGTTPGADTVFTTTSLANAGILWVDLRATDATAGTATWHNRGALGNFARVGTPVLASNASATGIPGVQFNGTNNAYESFALADADISFNSDRTIEAWVLNPALAASETAVSEGRALGRRSVLRQDAGSTNAWSDNTTSLAWTTAPLASAWHHMVLVHSGTSILNYVDGVLISTTPITDGSNTLDESIVLGASRDAAGALDWTNLGLSGFINSVRLHGGALTPAQITSNFNAGPYLPAVVGVAPLAYTSPTPTQVTTASAILHGTVTPGGLPTTAWIEWGTSVLSLTNTTPTFTLPNTFSTYTLNEPIGNLGGQTIYYRVVAANNAGHDEGNTENFLATGSIPNLPTAQTISAAPVAIKTATLNGQATPNGLASTAWFEYGPKTSPFGITSTSKTSITAATASKTMTVPVSSLKPHTTYWFRLVVENTAGRVVGEKLEFTTGNTPPVATLGSITIKEDALTTLSLKGTDADGETLQITNVVQPAHGFVSGTSLNPVYTPELNFVGTTGFSFAVTDGAATSSSVTFTVTTTAVADVPFAPTFGAGGNEDTTVTGPTGAFDPDGDDITSYAVVTPPLHGQATISPTGVYSYVPNPNFYGTDSFFYTASNAGGTSAPGEIDIVITGQPDVPVATNSGVWTDLNTPVNGQAQGADPDGNFVSFTKLSDPAPTSGTISAFNSGDGTFTFTPFTGFTGTDSFTFKVNDGTSDSNVATITLTVGAATAEDGHFSGPIDDLISDQLIASAPGNPALDFDLVTAPMHGEVEVLDSGVFYYNPNAGYLGNDSFTFKAKNGVADSNTATVFITITPRPPQWIWQQGPNTAKKPGIYGTKTIADAANIPGARGDAASWTDANNNLWVFGGSGYGTGATAGLLNDLWMRNVISGQWTWFGGASTTNTPGNYGAQGLAANANAPGARSGAVSWVGLDGKLWLFGGTGRDTTATGNGLLNDLWFYDTTLNQWTWKKGSNFINANGTYGSRGIPASTNSPGARTGASGWVDAFGRLWMFGGSGRGATGTTAGNLNDLWCYSPVTNQWTWIGGVSTLDPNGTSNTIGFPSATGTPSGRSFATPWVGTDGQFYLFGGSGRGATGTTKGNLNDLWVYNWTSNAWTWLTGSSAVNGASSYGLRGVPAPTNTPGARSDFATLTDGTSNTLLFGGQGSGAMNDLWRYDEVSRQWTWLNGPTTTNGAGVYGTRGVAAPANTPGARRGIATITDGTTNTLLFGGNNGANSFSDVWSLESSGAPLVRTQPPGTITNTTAQVRSYVGARGISTLALITWWPLGDPGNRTTASAGETITDGSQNNLLVGLQPGTTYVYQARAINANGEAFGREVAFTTTGSAAAIKASFELASITVAESVGIATAKVVLDQPATTAFTMPLTLGGTATVVTDYTAPALSLSFVAGQSAAFVSFPIADDGIDEGSETVVLTLGAPTGGVTLGVQTSTTVTIGDDEDLPAFLNQPQSRFAKVGDSVTFSVLATGSNVKFQWKKNGTKITGATSSTYTLTAALTSAATYICEVSNSLTGVTPIPSNVAELFVVDATPKKTVLASGNTSFTVNAAGPAGTTLDYVWRSTVSDPLPDVPTHIAGAATKTLAFTGLAPTDSEFYVCKVSKLGTPALFHDSGIFTLAVPSTAPVVTTATLPPAVVGVPYSYQVTVDPALIKTPTSYIFSGLPSGLTGSTSTGLITGKPKLAGVSTVSISARNGAGTSTVVTPSLTVVGLPDNLIGSFAGLFDRGPSPYEVGGRLEITVTSLGVYTAKVLLPGVTGTTSVTSSVTPVFTGPTVTSATGFATFKLSGGAFGATRTNAASTLSFDIDAATGNVTGTLTDGGHGINLSGGLRNVWLTGSNFANPGDYTALLDIPLENVGDVQTPQGSSYATFKTGADGKLTFAGKTADGIAYTLGTFAGPTGQLTGLFTFSGSTSLLLGSATPAIGAGGYLSGGIEWRKAPAATTSRDQAYRAGFDWTLLSLSGGLYPIIPVGGMVMNLPNADGNAKLSFHEAGLLAGDADDFVFNIRNNNLAKAVQTITYPTLNPNKISFALPASPVGSFNGSLTIPNPTASLARKVTFQGVITKPAAAPGYRSAGFFLLPQLPQPGQTLSTSPVLSGQVLLESTVP